MKGPRRAWGNAEVSAGKSRNFMGKVGRSLETKLWLQILSVTSENPSQGMATEVPWKQAHIATSALSLSNGVTALRWLGTFCRDEPVGAGIGCCRPWDLSRKGWYFDCGNTYPYFSVEHSTSMPEKIGFICVWWTDCRKVPAMFLTRPVFKQQPFCQKEASNL